MGKRREPRKTVELPVRVFGSDREGKIFSENLTAVEVSQNGLRIKGLRAKVKVDEVVGVTSGQNKVHFRVKWVGAAGTGSEGQAGLVNLNPEKPFWDVLLPEPLMDNFQAGVATERRKSARVKCEISVEMHPPGQPVIWGKAADLSQGGCFVEMPIPLKVGTKFEIALWLGSSKLRLKGEVVSASPGFGNGVRFSEVSPQAAELLQKHVLSMTGHS